MQFTNGKNLYIESDSNDSNWNSGFNLWLIRIPLSIQQSNKTFSNAFRDIPLRLDSYAFGFFEGAHGRLNIRDIYKVDQYAETVLVVDYGQWDPATGVTILEENIWRRRSNLQGNNIRYFLVIMFRNFERLYIVTIIRYELNYFYIYRIVTGVYPPYVTYVEDGCKSPNCFKGFHADVFHELQSLLNFTYTVSVAHGAGSRLANQSWTGLIG